MKLTAPTVRRIQLQPPELASHNRAAEIGCIRSMRRGGPRIATEQWDDQIVTHAYGFGGSGWTLAPGAAHLAVNHFNAAQAAAPERFNAETPELQPVALDAWKAWSDIVTDHAKTRVWEARGARFMDAYEPRAGAVNFDAYVAAGVMPPPETVCLQFGASGPSHVMDRYQSIFINTEAMMHDLHWQATCRGVVVQEERVGQLADSAPRVL